jgi:hypothetical protein
MKLWKDFIMFEILIDLQVEIVLVIQLVNQQIFILKIKMEIEFTIDRIYEN